MLTTIPIIIGAYLIGSISFAVVVSRLYGLPDPHGYGSGNPGATNVLRTGNKAAAALALFDVIETIDRVEIADRIESLLVAGDRVLPVFLEVNVGGEPQKSGVLPETAGALAEHVAGRCPHLRLAGVMAVPPYGPDPERSRPYFAALRALGGPLAARFAIPGLELSMGMSDDFEVAVEEGATLLRLGRVLFGERRAAA